MSDVINLEGSVIGVEDRSKNLEPLVANVSITSDDGSEKIVCCAFQSSLSENLKLKDFVNGDTNYGGGMDGDGNLIVASDFMSVSELESAFLNLSRCPVESIFDVDIDQEGNRTVYISALSQEILDQTYRSLMKSGFMNANTVLRIVDNFRENGRILFQGRFGEYDPNTRFVPDSEYPQKEGYRLIEEREVDGCLDGIFAYAYSEGKKVLYRNDIVPRFPDHILSGTLIAPDHMASLPRENFRLAGGFIIVIEDEAALLCFEQDADTAKHINGIRDEYESRHSQPGWKFLRIGADDLLVSWAGGVHPVSIEDLQRKLQNGDIPEKSHNEVMFDPKDPRVRVVAVVNETKVSGWSKLA